MTKLRLVFPLLLAFIASLSLFLTGCEPKEDIVTHDPAATLTASVDTVKFDTVFVARGSVTKRFWVYNRNPKAVRVDEVRLMGSSSSKARFELVIDGRPGPARRDFDLRGKDSLLVLVKVTVDPNSVDTAFVVMDSVQLRANGATSFVKLRAFGENARYYTAPEGFAPVVACGEIWTAATPIVLLRSTLVDSMCVLTIEPGTRVYLAPGASLVVGGRLICGQLGQKLVKFQGLRRESYYANVPGQWGTIAFVSHQGSQQTAESQLLNTDIRNAIIGVQISNARYLSGQRVRIESCFIRNAYTAGVLGIGAGLGGGQVELINTAIAHCGQYAVAGLGGGNYRLAHCTVEMGSAVFPRRDTEALAFNNAVDLGDGLAGNGRTDLIVENSIIWSGLLNDQGKLQNEILLLREGSIPDSSYVFRNSVLQTPYTRFNTNAVYNPGGLPGTNQLNQNPDFRNTTAPGLDLRLDSLNSPARGICPVLTPAVPNDILNQVRPSPADAGAYEAFP